MRLEDYRKLKGLSRAKAAAQLSTTGVTIYRYETGRLSPSTAAIRRIVEWSRGAVTAADLLAAAPAPGGRV